MGTRDTERIAESVGVEPRLILHRKRLESGEVEGFLTQVARNENSLNRLLFAGEVRLLFECDGNAHVAERTVRDLYVRRHPCSGLEFLTGEDESSSLRFCPRKGGISGKPDIRFKESVSDDGVRKRQLTVRADNASVDVVLPDDTAIIGVRCVTQALAREIEDERFFQMLSRENGLQMRLIRSSGNGDAGGSGCELHDPQSGLTLAIWRAGDKFEMGTPFDFEAANGQFKLPYARMDGAQAPKYIADALEAARLKKQLDRTPLAP